MNRPRSATRLDPADNVVSLLRAHRAGEHPAFETGEGPALNTDLPAGHKVALCDIAKGQRVLKYGVAIGRATAQIAAGDHVHLHNLRGEIG